MTASMTCVDNNIQVILGRTKCEQRLQHFVKIFKAYLQHYETNIAVVDMRYTNGTSVIWRQGQKPDLNQTI